MSNLSAGSTAQIVLSPGKTISIQGNAEIFRKSGSPETITGESIFGPYEVETTINIRAVGNIVFYENLQQDEEKNDYFPVSSSKIDRAKDRYFKKYVPALSRLFVAGDSYAQGAGATTPTTGGWGALLAAIYSGRLVYGNYGSGGTAIANYSLNARFAGSGDAFASRLKIVPDDITLSIMGLNDLKGVGFGVANVTGCGPNPDNFQRMKSRAMHCALHFLVPYASRVKMLNDAENALNPAVAVTGSWTVALGEYKSCAFTSTAGASATFNTPKGNLLIIKYGTITTGNTATISVTIDGVSYGDLSAKASFDTNWCPDCMIIPLPTNQEHTVVLSRLASSPVIESVDCVDTTLNDFSATFVYATPGPLNDGVAIGWNTGTGTANSATAAGAAGALAWNYGNGALYRFSQAIHEAMNVLYEYGFNVIPVDIESGLDLSAMMNADTLHRNDAGHIHLHRPFRRVIDALIEQ